MNQEPEQIGELTYLPNPDYPYPFETEKPPHYWMTEQTGRLAEAVETYYSGEKLPAPQLELIKQYLRQFVDRSLMTGDANRRLLLERVEKLKTTRNVEDFAEELAEFGVEAF